MATRIMCRPRHMPGFAGIQQICKPVQKFSSGTMKRVFEQLLSDHRKSLEVLHRNQQLIARIKMWLARSSISPLDVLHVLDCIKRLIKIMKYSYNKLIWPIAIYVETYVKRTRRISEAELLPLLVVAASVAMKMWEDLGPDLDLMAFVSGTSKRDISALERVFLEKLNYSLCLDNEFIVSFRSTPPTQPVYCPCVEPAFRPCAEPPNSAMPARCLDTVVLPGSPTGHPSAPGRAAARVPSA
eukprot:TRINITY_DN148_c2_g1_i1.p1 TRINITY_DN148_c2_g1~~TRINITY_DN148_c2_g1_i1.p1  ORF type:complete len:241 (-),score=31.10 TRINITY_DN148_c2_g1_i1:531-1253(-)